MPASESVLRQAAEAAVAAPSIFNTQPWRWQLGHGTMRLWADRARQLLVADPTGRMLTISCGVALHHARLVIATLGSDTRVERLPDSAEPDLLAEIHTGGVHEPSPQQWALRAAILMRRTDRRPFKPDPVPRALAQTLVGAAEAEGAHLHLIRRGQIAQLAIAALQAGATYLSDPAYRRELIHWTQRPEWAGDGVPVATAIDRSPRPVPVRDFAPFSEHGMPANGDNDCGALYALVFTDRDEPASWLQAGEALSIVLLHATAAGLGTAPISDVTELSVTRDRLRYLLPTAGHPQLAVRVGWPPPGAPPPVPRRQPAEIIDL